MQAKLYKDKQQETDTMSKMPKDTEYRYPSKLREQYTFFLFFHVENYMHSSYVEQYLKDKDLFQ